MKNITDLLSVSDLTREQVTALLTRAAELKKQGIPFLYGGSSKIVATLFFEASTRTRLSFEAAAHRLGARVIGFDNPSATSYAQKGESLEDTIRMIDSYADVIVMRHPETESAGIAAEIASHPVVNAGNGAGEHPTQVLVDVFTMMERQGKVDGLTVAIVGDLKHGRVPHSLAQMLAKFDAVKQIWVHPPQLPMPEHIAAAVHETGAEIEMSGDLSYAVQHADVVYMTRVQAERFEDEAEYQALKDAYILTPEILEKAKENMMIMHALPRRYELPESIDVSPHAAYFEQAGNAVVVRAAILEAILENA